MGEVKQTRSLSSRLASGGAWTLFGRLVTVVAGFLVNALIARMLPAAEVGAYFLLLSLVTAGSIIASFGMQVTVVRLVAQAIARGLSGVARATVEAVLGLGFVGSIIVAFMIGFGGDIIALGIFNSPIMADTVWYASFWLIVLVILTLLAEAFRGFHDFRYATIFSNNTSTNVLTAVLLAIFFMMHEKNNLHQILMVAIVSCVISIMIAGAIMTKKLGTLGAKEKLPVMSIIKDSLPLMLSSVSIYLLTQADLWIIGMFLSGQDVAAYGAAMRLGQLVYMPLLISNTLLPPFIAEMYSLGKIKELETVIRVTSTLSAITAAVMLVVFIVAGRDMLALAYGDYYRKSYLLLILLSAGQFVNVWSGSGMITLMHTGNQRAVFTISLVFGSLIVIGSLLVVKHYGVSGVALVTGVVTFSQALFVLFLVKRETGMWTHAGRKYLTIAIERLNAAKCSG
jgi:O-antigen/teichoic acid export membrane protein